MLGHASATLTLDRYGHLFDDELDAVADHLDEVIRKIGADRLRTGAEIVALRTAPQAAGLWT